MEYFSISEIILHFAKLYVALAQYSLIFVDVVKLAAVAYPRLAHPATLEATALEQSDACGVKIVNLCPYLLYVQGVESVLLHRLYHLASIAVAAVALVVDEDAEAETQVLRVEVDDIHSAHRDALCLDYHTSSSSGVNVVILTPEPLLQTHSRYWLGVGSYAPNLGVVLPFVELLDIARLHRPYAATWGCNLLHSVALQADNLVADEHRNTPGIGAVGHLRDAEFGVLVYEVERVFARR